MRYCLLPLALCVLLSACSISREAPLPRRTTVFPRFTSFGSTENLPEAIVSDMPRRIQKLSTQRIYTVESLLRALGLSRYGSHLSINMRMNHYFVYLNQDHLLSLLIDVTTKKETREGDWLAADRQAHVLRVVMAKNPDLTVITKDLHSGAADDQEQALQDHSLDP